jgi:nucleoside-diphosphate-sugar epimerase
MKLFITGCESFVGKVLIKKALEMGHEIVGVDAVESNSENCFKQDILNNEISDLIPTDTDALIHLAALSRDQDCKGNGLNCFNTNVIGTLNLYEAAKRKNVKQFIFASTEWVYDTFDEDLPVDEATQIIATNHTSEYAFSKLVSEINLKQSHLQDNSNISILRFGIIYGTRKNNWSAVESIFNTVRTKDEISVGSLRTARRFIHVQDIAEGILSSLNLNGYEVINIQGKTCVSLNDIIQTSELLLGKKINVVETNPDQANIRNVSGEKAKTILDWEPKISLKEGLESLMNYLNEENG